MKDKIFFQPQLCDLDLGIFVKLILFGQSGFSVNQL